MPVLTLKIPVNRSVFEHDQLGDPSYDADVASIIGDIARKTATAATRDFIDAVEAAADPAEFLDAAENDALASGTYA